MKAVWRRKFMHRLCVALVCALAVVGHAHAEGLVDTLVRRFAQSDFEFVRARNNAPFLPVAWATAAVYDEAQFTRPDGSDVSATFRQSSVSEAAFLPLPIGRRDIVVMGEWMSLTQFERTDVDNGRDLELLSLSVPVGWIRQVNPDWQVAAFVAPLGHKTEEDDWYWETMGGLFARRVAGDRVAWIFGAYFDVSPLEDFYCPYVGATFVLNERWSINAVMPWPSINYSPDTDSSFRFGVTPSGASWSLEPGERRPRVSFSAWNFGFVAERRVYQNLWVGLEVGVSGLRGLSLIGGDWQGLETKLDNTGFALLMFNFRPPNVSRPQATASVR